MKIKAYMLLPIIFITIILTCVYLFNINNFIINKTQNNNSTNLIQINSSATITPNPDISNNITLTIPPNDFIINNIHWSSYPNLQTGYIHLAQVMEPNDYVPHKFIAIGVMTEIKDTTNNTIIFEQLSDVARDVRRICGPNTAIVIFGMDHGVNAWTVTMKVYDDNAY